MGDTQRLNPAEQLALAREQYESAQDFTVAVEEEFAVLDPETLDLTNRFEELQAAAQGTALEEHLVGELIASEVEVRTGRCDTFEEAAAQIGERREQLHELADDVGVALGATGTHPWSPWQDQRIIDTPHYRRNDEILQYVVWRNNSFGLHVHVAINGPDRAVAVCNGLRNYLPELLALSASSPFVENVNTGLHSARTEIFTRMFPRCGIPDTYDGWDGFERYVRFLYDTRSIERAHAALVERPPASRLPDGRDPHLRRAARPRRGALAGRALLRADRADRARPRRGRAAARLPAPADRGEPLARDPLRPLGRADRPRDRRRAACARAPRAAGRVGAAAAEELGCADYLTIPAANAAERQIARHAEGASLREIYAEQRDASWARTSSS